MVSLPKTDEEQGVEIGSQSDTKQAYFVYNISEEICTKFSNFVMFWFGWVFCSFTHILHDYFTGTGAINCMSVK